MVGFILGLIIGAVASFIGMISFLATHPGPNF